MILHNLNTDTQTSGQPFRKSRAGYHPPNCFLQLESFLKRHFIERSVPCPLYYVIWGNAHLMFDFQRVSLCLQE
jgi:hypothetical protein